jgi:hypothetical protein
MVSINAQFAHLIIVLLLSNAFRTITEWVSVLGSLDLGKVNLRVLQFLVPANVSR